MSQPGDPRPGGSWRGRVLWVDAGRALVRGAQGDREVAAEPTWRPGDLLDCDGATPRVVRPYPGGDYPAPGHEVARLPRRRLENLAARAKALAALRDYFSGQRFLEVETPLWVRAPGLEVALDPVPCDGGWLITSPEFQMKRLLAAGLERIFQVCRCFRNEERGPHHEREFTMVEWYRAYQDLDAIAADVEALVASVCRAVTGAAVATVGGRRFDVTPPWPRATVAEVMARHGGVEVRGDEPAEVLAARARAAGVTLPAGRLAWDDVFYTVFVERVDPALAALDHPLLVTDWPLPLAALARQRADGAPVVERFEAYVGGLELANAFGELTDVRLQAERFAGDVAERVARGISTFAPDPKLLAALAEGLPPCAGVALGFDRLVMLATGAVEIRDVLAFAHDEL